MRVIKISCCNECPLCYSQSGFICNHPLYGGRSVINVTFEIPNWCPLDTPQTAGFVEASAQQTTAQCCSVDDSHISETETSA